VPPAQREQQEALELKGRSVHRVQLVRPALCLAQPVPLVLLVPQAQLVWCPAPQVPQDLQALPGRLDQRVPLVPQVRQVWCPAQQVPQAQQAQPGRLEHQVLLVPQARPAQQVRLALVLDPTPSV
jgi:hypothetical protein